ncbi:MAG: BlaI/MecI/CopY family transcriptional regulator [Planctomycetes bacterium]|nr:BlaI/MecI/CopY family transcriptional regulator [Planctomycetota bacterium]MCC7173103.1 BlaI/MecI/CopY family transcriptional regulator [Planctomycetota bacterium]
MADYELGDLQLAIMAVLWERGEATTNDVHTALHPSRGLAPTTIATMLQKLEKKGVVTHRAEGRQFVYSATIAREDVRRSMVGALLDRLFQGDGTALVNHLLEAGDVDADELRRLKAQIQSGKRGRKSHGDAR